MKSGKPGKQSGNTQKSFFSSGSFFAPAPTIQKKGKKNQQQERGLSGHHYSQQKGGGSGNQYYDDQGNLLWQDNTGGESIRIIPRSDWEHLNGDRSEYRHSMHYNEMIQSYSYSLAEWQFSFSQHKQLATQIANRYYVEAGYNLNELENNSITIVKGGGFNANAAYGEQFDLPQGKARIKVNITSIGKNIMNKYDFINLYHHEMQHVQDFKTNLSKNPNFKYNKNDPTMFWKWERKAVRKQIKHPSWKHTSLERKQALYNSYGHEETVLSYPEQEKYFGQYGIQIDYWTGSFKALENRRAFSAGQPAPYEIPDNVYQKPSK